MIPTHGPGGTDTETLSQPGGLFTSLLSMVGRNSASSVRLMDEDDNAVGEDDNLFASYVREATNLRSLSGTLQMSYLVSGVRF